MQFNYNAYFSEDWLSKPSSITSSLYFKDSHLLIQMTMFLFRMQIIESRSLKANGFFHSYKGMYSNCTHGVQFYKTK